VLCFDTFRGFSHKIYAATMDGKGEEGTHNFFQDDWGDTWGAGHRAQRGRKLGVPFKRLIAKGKPNGGAKHRCKCQCRAWKWTPFWLVAKLVFAGSRFNVNTMRSYFPGFKRLDPRTNSRHTKSGQLATISYVIQHTAMSKTHQKSAKTRT